MMIARIVVAAVLGVLVGCDSTESRPPQHWDMWDHKVSLLSDSDVSNELLQAHIKWEQEKYAARQYNQKMSALWGAQLREWRQEYGAALSAHYAERPQECSSSVGRVRNLRECQLYDPVDSDVIENSKPPAPKEAVARSRDAILMERVLGACADVATVREARAQGCLPETGGVSKPPGLSR